MSDTSTNQFYFTHNYGQWSGEQGEVYHVYDAKEQRIAQGIGKQRKTPLRLEVCIDSKTTRLSSKLSGGFAFNGKIELRDDREALLAVVNRNLKIYAPDGTLIVAIEDPTRWNEKVKQSLIQAFGDALLGQGDNPSNSSVNRYALLTEGQVVGDLCRGRLPFTPEPTANSRPNAFKRTLKKILPSRFLEPKEPVGWTLRLNRIPEPLSAESFIGAIGVILELNRWSG